MSRRWSVGIAVPARDEGERIDACLASILSAEIPSGTDVWVVVAADGCTDRTAAIAAGRLGRAGEVVEVTQCNVGAARRVATAAALAHFRRRGARPTETWLLTTDADSTVDPTWITSHLHHADRGTAAVAGTVQLDPSEVQDPGRPGHDAYHRQYTIHPDGSHPHVHGANLGVRADAYVGVGGWHPLATAEDHDLWNRLRSAGHPILSSVAAPVTTSVRRDGRAPEGFAALLASLSDASEASR